MGGPLLDQLAVQVDGVVEVTLGNPQIGLPAIQFTEPSGPKLRNQISGRGCAIIANDRMLFRLLSYQGSVGAPLPGR